MVSSSPTHSSITGIPSPRPPIVSARLRPSSDHRVPTRRAPRPAERTPPDTVKSALCSPLFFFPSLDGSDGLRRSFPTKKERAESHRDVDSFSSLGINHCLPRVLERRETEADSTFPVALSSPSLVSIVCSLCDEKGELSVSN